MKKAWIFILLNINPYFFSFGILIGNLQFSKYEKLDSLACKSNVGTVKSTLISFSNGLGQSIFSRKTEGTRLVEEKVDGKVFISRQCQHFSFDVHSLKYFSTAFFTSAWCVNNYVSRQGKKNRRNEATKLVNFCTGDINQSPFRFSHNANNQFSSWYIDKN